MRVLKITLQRVKITYVINMIWKIIGHICGICQNILFLLIFFEEDYENVVINSINRKYLSNFVLKQTNIISIFDSTKLVESSRKVNKLISCDG